MTSTSPASQTASDSVNSPVIVALDFANATDALNLAKQLDPTKCRVKVGKELFTRVGPSIVEQLHELGFDVFLDLKFHDIPNTTAQAVLAAAEMGVWMVNIHATAGAVAMKTVMSRLQEKALNTKVIAVTVLTSMDEAQLSGIGLTKPVDQVVKDLAQLTHDNGLNGIVCSAQEAQMLREHFADDFLLVTPGIRMADDASDDQKRICTPKQAMENGSSYLVIGRSITKAADPLAALDKILESLK